MDKIIFDLLHSVAGSSTLFDQLIVFCAVTLPYFLIIISLIFIYKQKSFRSKILTLLFLSFAVLFGRGFITEIINYFYNRSRPFEVLSFEPLISGLGGYSFPSGHVVLLFTISFSIFYLNRGFGIWFLGLSILNGFARVIAGVHWPVDFLGGIVIAFISFLVSKYLILKNRPIISKSNF